MSDVAVQFMTAEHFALQGARTATITGANGRHQAYLGVLSAVVVALAFIAQIDRIWRFPLHLDVANADQDTRCIEETGIPEPGVDHLGDAEVHRERLYVAMESTDPARVGV